MPTTELAELIFINEKLAEMQITMRKILKVLIPPEGHSSHSKEEWVVPE